MEPLYIEPLTKRQLEIAKALATGTEGTQLAKQLFISINTLRSHQRSIYLRLGAHNLPEMVRALILSRQLSLEDFLGLESEEIQKLICIPRNC